MDFRLAGKRDLPRLKTMYEKIIDNMNGNNIRVWNAIYPCESFREDIENNSLYVLTGNGDIIAAFALCAANDGEGFLKWENVKEKALYMDRLGVNVAYSRKGIGGVMLNYARELAKQKDAKYLRLFVVNVNKPAINLYLKNGFRRVAGIFEERIDDFVLCEYGFEIAL